MVPNILVNISIKTFSFPHFRIFLIWWSAFNSALHLQNPPILIFPLKSVQGGVVIYAISKPFAHTPTPKKHPKGVVTLKVTPSSDLREVWKNLRCSIISQRTLFWHVMTQKPCARNCFEYLFYIFLSRIKLLCIFFSHFPSYLRYFSFHILFIIWF